jgi:antitoxin ParD1/3/4
MFMIDQGNQAQRWRLCMKKPFQVTLDEPLDRFVVEQVESGRFASPQAVVEAGLRLLEEDQRKLEWLCAMR